MRYRVPSDFAEWWSTNVPDGRYEIRLRWRGGDRVKIGHASVGTTALRVDLQWLAGPHWQAGDTIDNFCEGGNRMSRLVGQAMARAGWQRPLVDPAALAQLIGLRNGKKRLEFVLDTNAMVEGIGHWLIDLFADKCDVVVTAVSLRELQDHVERAKFTQPLPERVKERNSVLGSRNVYLAANRLRENTGYEGVLWRELAMEDTALLLSRGGSSGTKSSESDTMLLRAVRRSILDRVNGLERFFVTGDVALARRATSELPADSVIAARVQDAEAGKVYSPCSWWPGPDQGRGMVRSTPRLIWELLSFGDSVEVEGNSETQGKAWSFESYDKDLWPSDYSSPWVRIEPLGAPVDAGGNRARPAPTFAPSEATRTPVRATPTRGVPPHPAIGNTQIWSAPPLFLQELNLNIRVPGDTVMDALASFANGDPRDSYLPENIVRSPEQLDHLRQLLNACAIATVDEQGHVVGVGTNWKEFVAKWRNNDLDGVFDILRVLQPLNEWATLEAPPTRPTRTQESVRALAQLLGQGMKLEGAWARGGLRPNGRAIRSAIIDALESQSHGPRGLPIYNMLIDVFLKQLGVGPARVVSAWERLEVSGAFSGLEFRTGGSSTGKKVEVAHLTPNGWSKSKIDLEAVRGYRDLVIRRSPRV